MRCVIAGSYRRFYERILHEVMPVFEEAGIEVLYPPKSRIVNSGEDFPLFEGDVGKDSFDIERGFIDAGLNSDFIYLYNPDGYIGNTSAFETGWFLSTTVPIYVLQPIDWGDDRPPIFDVEKMIRKKGGFYTPTYLVEYLRQSGLVK